MNRFEFKEVMNAFGIIATMEERYGIIEEIYHWDNLKFSFDTYFYATVYGRIPLEVANIIYEKYPNNPFRIMVGDVGDEYDPSKYATDDRFKKAKQEYGSQDLEFAKYLSKCRIAERNFRRRIAAKKYIEFYRFYTKEGLIIFLNEMKDYYLRKANKPETEVERNDELITKVSSEMLKKINPSISAYDWMQDDELNKVYYNSSVDRDSKTALGKIFRNAILEFDKAVNPFTSENIELDDISNYLKKVRIDASLYDSLSENKKNGCCELSITDLDTGYSTFYSRRPDGFLFSLISVDHHHSFKVEHYYSSKGTYESSKGEVIAIHHYRKNMPDMNIVFNITKGNVEATYTEPTIFEQITFIYDEFIKATSYASKITIENMRKKRGSKKLSLKG